MFTLNDGGVLEVVLWGTSTIIGQVRLVFQLQLQANGPANAAQIATDLAEYLLGFVGEILPLTSNTLTYNGFSWNTLDDNVVSGFIPFSSPQVGAETADPLTDASSFFIYANTGEAHRQLRKYLPGFTEDNIGPFGGFSSATLTALANVPDYLLDTFNALSGRDWHYGHARPGISGSWVEPQSVVLSAVPAYQRRRRRGRGI